MSEKFVWNEKYSVNVAEIDKQHKHFVEICNDLLDLVDSDSFSDQLALITIMKLGDYAFYHLDAEEELFAKTQYPEIESHKEIHDLFRKRSQEYINQVRDKKVDTREIIREAAAFAGEWLLNHIKLVDKLYSAHLNEHGIT